MPSYAYTPGETSIEPALDLRLENLSSPPEILAKNRLVFGINRSTWTRVPAACHARHRRSPFDGL